MRIAMIGAGGVGGLLGGRLAHASRDVTFFARGAHAAAMRQHGLRVDSFLGDFRVPKVKVMDGPGVAGTFDAVIVTVKAWQLTDSFATIRPLLRSDSVVVPLLNGLDAADQLRAGLDTGIVAGGLCAFSAHIEAPGHIKHVGTEPQVVVGTLDRSPLDALGALRDEFLAAGVKASVSPDIRLDLWRKYAFIGPVGAVGALAGLAVGGWRTEQQWRNYLRAMIEEARAVARAEGVTMPEDEADGVLARVDALNPEVKASMHRDIEAGRPSEPDAQVGAVVRRAAAHSVDVPRHAEALARLS
jgi:2-dehydropantoate 2-reductase